MRKTLLASLIASLLAAAGSANAALTFDLDGTGSAAPISVNAFDWAPTSFLALNGAIATSAANPVGQTFDVLSHAKLTGYTDGNNVARSLPAFNGEITMVTRFSEVVTGVFGSIATFATTGSGWLEMYYSPTANSNQLTGSGFDDGTLIMRVDGVKAGLTGFFNKDIPSNAVLDQFGADNYAGQKTVTGVGAEASITYGDGSVPSLDSDFFKNALTSFKIIFSNLSIDLPFVSVDPSDCFNPNATGTAVGSTNVTTQCQNAHDNTKKYAGQGTDGGYLPQVGSVNGDDPAAQGGPDFVAQTDFNSPVVATTPEPGSIALLGLALGALGLSSRRRRV